MEIIIYSLLGIIFILLIIISFTNSYNKFQNYIIRLNEVDSNIDTTLRKKYDLLLKINRSISPKGKDLLEDIVKLKDTKKISSFDLDRILEEQFNLYFSLKEKELFKEKKETIKTEDELNNTEVTLNAYRRYYNDWITRYNHYVKKFPSNVVALLGGFNVKPYYDTKDRYDNDINDFKL